MRVGWSLVFVLFSVPLVCEGQSTRTRPSVDPSTSQSSASQQLGQTDRGAAQDATLRAAMGLQKTERLMVADFNQPSWQTNLGDPFGGWDHDPSDRTQFCRPRLVDEPRLGNTGYTLMLEYDVDSPNPAFNGFWMKLHSIPLHDFRVLSFAMRGDPDRGYTKRVKLELKDARHRASYVLDGIQPTWVRMRIPLKAFQNIEHIKAATEFVIVFDDHTVTEKSGTLYLDDVAFETAP